MRLVSILVLFLLPFASALFHQFFNRLGVWVGVSNTKKAMISIAAASIGTWLIIAGIERHSIGFGTTMVFTSFALPLLGHLYFQVFNLSETARRINILVTLKKHGKFAQDTHYAPADLVKIRLGRLRDLKQVDYTEGVYSTRLTLLTTVSLLLRGLERFLYPKR